MNREQMLDILRNRWGDLIQENGISAKILLSNVPPDISSEDLIRHADAFKLRHKASWRLDDDEYWLGQNPFDQRWHLFVVQGGLGWPREPFSITVEYPVVFDEEW
jgi:hypothetical protein